MADYDVVELGALETWGEGTGKRFIDKEIPTQFVGTSANALSAGGDAPFWHSHSTVEEVG